MSEYFILINFDGYCVGFKDSFNGTWLEFDSMSDAYEVISWYTAWLNGVDL